MKGYFSDIPQGGQSRIFYVWDIFYASGQRTNRFEGERIVTNDGSDPWSGATPQIMTEIARASIAEIARFVNSGGATAQAPIATPALALSAPDGTAERAANRRGASSADIGVADLSRQASGAGTAVHIAGVSGLSGAAGPVLSRALQAELRRFGLRPVAAPSDAAIRISGEATHSARQGASHTVGIIWTIADAAGRPLGTVRQVNKLAPAELSDAWGGAATRAATAAAPGIVLLASEG